jgi:hypothetical protein
MVAFAAASRTKTFMTALSSSAERLSAKVSKPT